MKEYLVDRIAGVVTLVKGPVVVLSYPEKPNNINPFPNLYAAVFRYEPDPPFAEDEAFLVLAPGYTPIIVRYPRVESLTIKSPAIHHVKLEGDGTLDVSDV
jgi:hypothetical protein